MKERTSTKPNGISNKRRSLKKLEHLERKSRLSERSSRNSQRKWTIFSLKIESWDVLLKSQRTTVSISKKLKLLKDTKSKIIRLKYAILRRKSKNSKVRDSNFETDLEFSRISLIRIQKETVTRISRGKNLSEWMNSCIAFATRSQWVRISTAPEISKRIRLSKSWKRDCVLTKAEIHLNSRITLTITLGQAISSPLVIALKTFAAFSNRMISSNRCWNTWLTSSKKWENDLDNKLPIGKISQRWEHSLLERFPHLLVLLSHLQVLSETGMISSKFAVTSSNKIYPQISLSFTTA